MVSTRHLIPGRENAYPGVYRRSRDESGAIVYCGKWAPRFKPPRKKLASGGTLSHDHLPLGGHDSPQEAKVHRDKAAFYYGKAEAVLDLENGQVFPIPPMSEQEKQNLEGLAKREWVAGKSKEVFQHFQKVKAAGRMLTSSVPSEVATTTTTTASSSVPTDTTEQFTAAPSLEDSTLDLCLTDFGSPELISSLDTFNVHALPNMSLEDILSDIPSDIPTWPCDINYNLSNDAVELDVNSLLSPQQASETLRSNLQDTEMAYHWDLFPAP